MAGQVTIFESTTASPLSEAVGWLTGTLLGSVATILCTLAIALVGLMMLSGRFPVRRGLQVAIGCFLLLGAPLVAITFTGVWRQPIPPQESIMVAEPADPRGDLLPADYDPYAGASLRPD
ncbi:TrbC/VirB2 family protein [Pelagerythrobacter rhizovicinus]|uniref:TrbC/VirB2 family protein n=1 Tax=Pelagerythrobacter rhizovicinus TaxID=2268576 RepID=A0A4Q2KIB0_9SPHN|nr:TrbC/VirB2 family protein [Pelagerythrobacter rhizovicinus]RXZ63900.1 hypothetical protein ETX26_08070 [Pelagerythrobacter rhizovicinus]